MAKDNFVTQEKFDVLLAWLDKGSRERAGFIYEKIRRRLIRIFFGRGCFEAEELADETINRVALKLPQIISDYKGEPALYFYGVAHNVYHEWLRKQKKVKAVPVVKTDRREEAEFQIEYECLEKCLKSLRADQRRLIIEYYRGEKRAKIENRRKLAEDLRISANALQVKALRIRSNLSECVRNCVAEKQR